MHVNFFMKRATLILVGLGNPGVPFEGTRHNVGFQFLDTLFTHYKAPAWKRDGKNLVSRFICEEILILGIKPQTFMNASGEALIEHRSTSIAEQWFVIHDDLDCSLGTFKFKKQGSAGGHRGLMSLNACLGTTYGRLRVGIDRPTSRENVSSYVIESFTCVEKTTLEHLQKIFLQSFPLLCSQLNQHPYLQWPSLMEQWTQTDLKKNILNPK
jgi:PTH1 family peptidyl-tRNA hydrolase